MKILITSYWYAPAINGVVTSVQNLEQELIKKGHEVRILTISKDRRSYKKDNIYYVGSLSLGKLYPHARLPIKSNYKYYKEIMDWGPDVVHSQCEFFTFYTGAKVAKSLDIPLIHTYHTIYEDYTHYFSPSHTVGKSAVALFSKKVLSKTDKVITPTNKVRNLLKSYEVKTDISTVPTGIDLEKFQMGEDQDSTHRLKRSLGLEENHKVMISVGRIAKEKNLDEIIDNLLYIDDEDVRLLIVGDGPYRKELEGKVQKMGLKEKVIFTGMVAPGDIQKYYDLGDVFISASNSETQGLTYIESLACGLPVVCKEDECVRDVVHDSKNGYLFNDRNSFVSSINSIFLNREEYGRLSKNAKESSVKFTKSVFASNMVEIYQDAIDARLMKSTGSRVIC